MSFKSWLSSMFQPRRRPIRKPARRTAPLSVELLEDRVTPAGPLATAALIEAPTIGIAADAVTTTGAWTAVANASWLHPTAGNSSGAGNGMAIFTLDANAGPTRVGTLTIAGETLTVTQAGSTYVAAYQQTSPQGSGAISSSVIVADAGGGFDVQLSYTYPEYLNNATFSVTVTDAGGASTSASTSTFSVADAPLTAATVSASGGVAGLIPTSLSAAFTDANTGAPTSDYSGTISWGDGNTTPFTSSAVIGSNGSYAVSGNYQYATAGNYNIIVTINDIGGSSASATGSTTVASAASFTTTIGAGPFTYDGSPQVGGSGTVTGAGGLNSTNVTLTYSANPDGTGVADETNAGTYYVTAHYAGDASHLPSSGAAVAITINKADATVVVTPYTAAPQLDVSQTAYGSALGFAAGNVYQTFTAGQSGLLTSIVVFQNGDYGGSSTIRIRQGAGLGGAVLATTTAHWSVTGEVSIVFTTPATVQAGSVYSIDFSDGIPSGATTSTAYSLALSKANPYSGGYFIDTPWTGSTVDQGYDLWFQTYVEPAGVTYDGNAHTATVTSITGVNGETGATVGTVTLNTTHTNAGTYTDSWSFTGTANYNNIASTPITDIINQASSTTTTIGAGPFTYNGSAQIGGSGIVSGAGVITGSATLTYSAHADGTGVADETDAGTYYVTAHYAGDANHTASDGTAVAITINKASSATTTVGAGPFTYNGSAQVGGSGTVTGANLSTSASSLTYSANADGTGTADMTDAGTYYVTAHYAGDANHTASDGSAVAIVINPAGQTINFAAPASPVIFAPNETVTLSASASSGETVAFSIDASSTGSGSITGNVLTITGAGSIVIDANQAGDNNYNAAPQVQQTLVVTPAPVTTASLAGTPGNNNWYVSDVKVTLSATETGPALAHTYYSLDGGATFKTYHGTFTVTGQGSHTVTYYSVDTAGTQESTHTITIQIDTVAPTTTASLSGTLGNHHWYQSALQVTLTADDATSGVAATYYQVDGGTLTTYGGAFDVNSDGRHMVTFYSVDIAGNLSATRTIHFKIDTQPPVTTASLGGTQGNNGWYTSAVHVTLTATDPTDPTGARGSGVFHTYYTLDGGPLTTYTGAFDVNSESTSFKIDSVNPTTAASLAGTLNASGSYTTAVQVTLTASDTVSGVAQTYYEEDGGPLTLYTGAFKITGSGKHTITFYSVDEAGNIEKLESASFKIA